MDTSLSVVPFIQMGASIVLLRPLDGLQFALSNGSPEDVPKVNSHLDNYVPGSETPLRSRSCF
jgi:hypothetical protein